MKEKTIWVIRAKHEKTRSWDYIYFFTKGAANHLIRIMRNQSEWKAIEGPFAYDKRSRSPNGERDNK